MPRLALAYAGMALLLPPDERPKVLDIPVLPGMPPPFDVTLAHAVLMQWDGNVTGATAMVADALDALTAKPETNEGWLIPVDPLLRVSRALDAWAGVLARLAFRAK